MVYNKKNKLLQIRLVVELYKKHKQPGVSTAYVFRTYIEPYYPMSISTLYNYLATPVEKELKQMENEKPQITLFD